MKVNIRSEYTHTYVCVLGGKKCSFFGKFGVLCFLERPVLRLALLPYYRRSSGSHGSNKLTLWESKKCMSLKLEIIFTEEF